MDKLSTKNGRRGNGEGTEARHVPSKNHWRRDVTVRDDTGGARRITVYGKTQRECNAKASTALNDAAKGKPSAGKQWTIHELLRAYLEHSKQQMESGQLRDSTYERYEMNIRLHLLTAFSAVKVNALKPMHIEAFLTQKRKELSKRTGKPLSAATIRNIRDTLRQAYAWGELNAIANSNPVKAVRLRQEQQFQLIQVLTPEEADKLLKAAEGDRLECLYWIGAHLGLRDGEVRGLTWAALDLDAKLLTVNAQIRRTKDFATGTTSLQSRPPKSQAGNRTLRLPDVVTSKLKSHKLAQVELRQSMGERWQEHDLVFTTRYGTPLDASNLTKYFHRHLERAGLPRMRFHDLRHSANSFLSAKGISDKARQVFLGHSDPRLTQARYTHALPSESDAIADAIDQRYREA